VASILKGRYQKSFNLRYDIQIIEAIDGVWAVSEVTGIEESCLLNWKGNEPFSRSI
jgi:hypothetical protein